MTFSAGDDYSREPPPRFQFLLFLSGETIMLRCLDLCASNLPGCRALLTGLCSLLMVSLWCGDLMAGGDRGVLVLTNGRVLGGQIDLNAGGYLVQSPKGSVLVPFDKIRMKAKDLQDAYQRLLASFPNPSPATHIALANWCMTQQMYDEAKIELRSALKFDPDNADARNMLRRLDEILKPTSAAADDDSNSPGTTADGFEAPPAVSLAGLPRESAIVFVTKVQPLMMNGCALAGCHATGGQNRFDLTRVRIGARSSRAYTEQNLAAMLKYIDYNDPDGSLLLTKPSGNHGRGGRPVFGGIRGTDQFELLRDWVREVATSDSALAAARRAGQIGADGSAETPLERSNFSLMKKKVSTELIDERVADLRDGRLRRSADSQANSTARTEPGVAANEREGGRPTILDAVRREERRDAFDPREFNRESTQLLPR